MAIESNAGRATQAADAPWPVMVLAHNEERHIAACLDSIFDAEPGRAFDIFVMANGCTDRTEAIVLEYGKRRPGVHLVSIAIGDKCNAWNVFVHETVPARCPGRDVYFFVDGDARFVPGSFSAMARGLEREPLAHAASAPPASGRSMRTDREEILRERGLVANLYALRGGFVHRLQQLGVRLPLGLEGDDGLIGAFVKWDLDPASGKWEHERIVPCPEAGFIFESMDWRRRSDWRAYWRRAVRYGRRRYEFELLGKRLESGGIKSMPRHINELYGGAAQLKLRWQGLYTLANLVALWNMRRFKP